MHAVKRLLDRRRSCNASSQMPAAISCGRSSAKPSSRQRRRQIGISHGLARHNQWLPADRRLLRSVLIQPPPERMSKGRSHVKTERFLFLDCRKFGGIRWQAAEIPVPNRTDCSSGTNVRRLIARTRGVSMMLFHRKIAAKKSLAIRTQ